MDKLGAFHANQISMCLDPHLNLGWGWRRKTGLNPPVKYFYWPFQGGTSFVVICVIYVLCLSCFCSCSLLPCDHMLGKGWPLGAHLWCLIVCLSLSNMVSLVRCGTWLYWFLIFSNFLTFILLDFSIAFDKVNHSKLLWKIHSYRIWNTTQLWIQAFLSNQGGQSRGLLDWVNGLN